MRRILHILFFLVSALAIYGQGPNGSGTYYQTADGLKAKGLKTALFNIISPQLIVDFKIDSSTVSLLSMIGMLMMGIASVVYSTLSDSVSIRKLMIFGISLLNIGALLSLLFSNMNFYLLLVSG